MVAAKRLCFCIKIVNNLHVVRYETDRRYDHVSFSSSAQCTQLIADIGFQPGNGRRTAATLKRELPVADAGSRRNQPSGPAKLLFVIAIYRHGNGNAVCCKNNHGMVSPVFRNSLPSTFDILCVSFNKVWMIVKRP